MRYSFLAFALIVSSSLFGITNEELSNRNLPPLSVTEGCPSSIVAGHVSAIEGTYFDHEIDFVVPGVCPLVFERDYFLDLGWCYCTNSLIKFSSSGDKKETKALYIDQNRSAFKFAAKASKNLQPFTLNPRDDELSKGVTNCSRGEISGRTHPKNLKVLLNPETQGAIVTTGSGESIQFYSFGSSTYGISSVRKPSGHRFLYEYDPFVDAIKKVSVTNDAQNVTFSHYRWTEVMSQNKRATINISDGRQCNFDFIVYRAREWNPRMYLNHVQRPEGPDIHYHYHVFDKTPVAIINKKEWPNGRYLGIDYILDVDRNDWRAARVRALKMPAGENGQEVVTHRFNYQKKGHKGDKESGYTEVLDPENHKTTYHYDKDHRLVLIEHFKGKNPYAHHHLEFLFWNPQGDLIAKRVDDPQGTILLQTYEYDTSGNVLTKRTYANFSGKQSYILHNNNIPLENQECQIQSYTYWQNGLNLKHVETQERAAYHHAYKPGTDLLTCRYLVDNSQKIRKRWFWEYDNLGAVSLEVEDDGETLEMHNLQGCTERHIRRYTNRTTFPVGLPDVIEEFAVDLETNTEHILKRIQNYYSTTGKLIRQETYDDQRQFQFAESWEYDSKGRLIKEVNPLGISITKAYDANDNLTSETTPDGTKQFTYDRMNRLTHIVETTRDGLKLKQEKTYNSLSQLVKETDIYGHSTSYEYDDMGYPIKITHPQIVVDGILTTPVTSKTYSPLGHVISETDPLKRTTHKAYNIRGQATSVSYPDGSTELFTYDKRGNLTESISKTGAKTCYAYDYLDRLLEAKTYSPDGQLLSDIYHSYDNWHLKKTQDAEGYITTFSYDFAGRLIAKEKEGSKTTYIYDSLGRVACESQWDHEQQLRQTLYTYDQLGQVLEEKIQTPENQTLSLKRWEYDFKGRPNLQAVGLSETKIAYNGLGEETFVTDPLGNVTETQYLYDHINEYGQKVRQTITVDPLGQRTLTTYDTHQRIVSVEKKDSADNTISLQKIAYDLVGNPIKVTNTAFSLQESPREIVTRWEYNTMNQITKLIDAADTADEKVTENIYNSYGQKEIVKRPNGIELHYDYDSLNRMISLKSSDDSLFYTYSYDKSGRLTRSSDEFTQAATIRQYDAQGNLAQEILANGLEVQYTYDSLGRITKLQLPQVPLIQYAYDALYLRQISYRGLSYFYQDYDLAGNLLTAKLPTQQSINNHYDLNNRLISLKAPHFNQKDLAYDAVGNLLFFNTIDPLGAIFHSYTYDPLYQLSSEEGAAEHMYSYDSLNNRKICDDQTYFLNDLNQVISRGDFVYTYDSNGNLVEKSSLEDIAHYAYDALDRLVSVSTDDYRLEYTYDAEHRRLSRRINWKESVARHISPVHSEELYLYLNEVEIAAYHQNTPRELRILGEGKVADIGSAVFFELNGQTYFPIHDHVGSTALLLDAQGNPTQVNRYSAFGEEVFNFDGEQLSPWRFCSKRVDPQTSLVHFGRRDYDPSLGRWITADPRGYDDGPNLYAYVHNNPLTHFDPTGLYDLMDENYSIQDCHRFNSQVSGGFMTGFDHPIDTGSRFWGYGYDVANCMWKRDFSSIQARCQGRNAQEWCNWSTERFGESLGLLYQASLIPTAWKIGTTALSWGVSGTKMGWRYAASKLGKEAVLLTEEQLIKETSIPLAGEASNCALHELYKTELRKQMEKPYVQNDVLKNLLNNLYRENGAIGNGSTAAAIRYEISTGNQVQGKWHSQKGTDMIKALERWIGNNPKATSGDRAAAENVIKDLWNAQGY